MLILFAVLFGGILTGRLFACWPLRFVSRIITAIIWLLLFLLGVEVGADPAVIQGIATLGWSAFVLFAGSTAGSIFAAWALWRRLQRRCEGASCLSRRSVERPLSSAASVNFAAVDDGGPGAPLWTALRGSLVIVAFFILGCAVGLSGLLSLETVGDRASTYVLYVLMFCVGLTLGSDTSLPAQIRQLNPWLAGLPLMTAVGTLGGAFAVSWLLRDVSAADGLAVGAGFGYYSLSSIFIADLKSVELGTVALLCNIMREIFTLLAAPLVARFFGPLAAVSVGGATSFDTTLPIITRAAGKQYAVLSIFHGCALDFSVPFLVTFFCSI